MRVAVLADIHGNLPACEAVLEDIRKVAPDYIVAAGDLALRGAHPREVVELVFDRCNAVLMGNTDCYLAGSYLGGAYRERDHWKTELLRWTRDQLGSTLTAKLGTLPFSVRYSPRRGQDLYVCHANPKNLEESLDPTLDEATVRRYFQHLDAAACAFGHLHFPYRRRVGRLLIADVASAGIPRDGDLRPAYGVFTFTPKGWRVQIRRVRYPVRKATQALTARRVPGGPLLIHKLVEARYRHHAALQEAARRHSGLPPTTAPTRALGMPAPGTTPGGAPRLRRPGEPAAEGEALPAARRGFASVPDDIRSALDGAPGAAGEDPAHALTAAEADALELDPGDPHAVDDLHEALDAHEAVPLDDVHGAEVHGADLPETGDALAPPAANAGSGAEAEPPEHPQRAANGDTEA